VKKIVAVMLALMLLGLFTLSVGCTKSEEKKPAEAPAKAPEVEKAPAEEQKPAEAPAAEKPAEAPAAEKPAEEPAKK
jgi:hypothetical protein